MSSEVRALTERLEGHNVQFQIEIREHFQDHKKVVTTELIRLTKLNTKWHQTNTVLEQQLMKSSSSSSSSGSGIGCMGFVQSCLGRAPAADPAVAPAVVPAMLCYEEPASSMPLEIEAASDTAAPPLELQEPAANTATPPSELNSPEEQRRAAELQLQKQQIQLQIDGVRRARPELNSQMLTSC